MQRNVEIGGGILINTAEGISSLDPKATKKERVLRRFLRITFFDMTTYEFCGNSTIIEADYNEGNRDIWTFPKSQGDTRDTNHMVFVGSSGDKNNNKYLIFEFVMVLGKEQPVEVSCGYAQVQIGKINTGK
jgi:hypothetical protein